MIPEKAYILRTNHPKSMEYSLDIAKSCESTNTAYEFIDWYQGEPQKGWDRLKKEGIHVRKFSGNPAAQCCYSGHLFACKKIIDSGAPGIVLEHDGLMLHPIEIDIPEDQIVVLGYKLTHPQRYRHLEAGPPKEIVPVLGNGHEGSHAYAITPGTAKKIIDETSRVGVNRPIDNQYFLKSRRTSVGISIMSPTPCIGWVRDSTIQKTSATRNYPFIDSFKQHLD